MNAVLERTKRFCGYLVGIAFFVSGILKLMDPVGTGLIVEEYYRFLHLDFLSFSSGVAAIALSLTETILGAALITGLWRRTVAVAMLAVMGFFTLISIALLIFNPPMDCGCFGEAVHLTHLQTFIKNLVLSALCCASFFPFSALGTPKKRKYVAFSLVTAGVVTFAVYSVMYLPLVDFTDYTASARLEASERHYGRSVAPEEEYEAVFIYEKNGRTREFSLDDLPDSTWTYVSTEVSEVGKRRTEESVVSLPVIDRSGEYHDELATGEKVMVVSVYAPESMPLWKWAAVDRYLRNVEENGFSPLLLVAASPETTDVIMDRIRNQRNMDTGFLESVLYSSDYKTLITLNRSNGGATLFNDGFLLRKWSFHALPGPGRTAELSSEDPTETLLSYSTVGTLSFQAILLYSFAVMLLL